MKNPQMSRINKIQAVTFPPVKRKKDADAPKSRAVKNLFTSSITNGEVIAAAGNTSADFHKQTASSDMSMSDF